jgi:acyl dehydratase
MDADARRTEQPRQAAPTSETSANHDPLARFQVGDAIGSSGWVLVSQDMIDRFGAVTHDPDPMHIDPAWARANGPFGGAIAFGFLTLSLLTYLFHQAVGTRADREEPGPGLYLNYGFDRVRLLSPVRAGSQVRGHFTLSERRVEAKGRLRFSLGVSVEVAGEERPALVADWLAMWTPHEPSAAG